MDRSVVKLQLQQYTETNKVQPFLYQGVVACMTKLMQDEGVHEGPGHAHLLRDKRGHQRRYG